MRTTVRTTDQDDEVVEEPERLLGLVALIAAEQGDGAEVRGQFASQGVLQQGLDLVGSGGGVDPGERDVPAQQLRDLVLEPLQGHRHQGQEVELHVVLAHGDVPVLVAQGGDELTVREAVDVHPETLGQLRAHEPVDLVDEEALESAGERGGEDLGVGRQGVLDARVEVCRLHCLGGHVLTDGRADLRVFGHGSDHADVGLGVEHDASRPQGEGADHDGEHRGHDQERGDAGAQPRGALRGEEAADGRQADCGARAGRRGICGRAVVGLRGRSGARAGAGYGRYGDGGLLGRLDLRRRGLLRRRGPAWRALARRSGGGRAGGVRRRAPPAAAGLLAGRRLPGRAGRVPAAARLLARGALTLARRRLRRRAFLRRRQGLCRMLLRPGRGGRGRLAGRHDPPALMVGPPAFPSY